MVVGPRKGGPEGERERKGNCQGMPRGEIMRMGVNTSQIPNGIESLADWHNFYFVQKYRRDDQQPDGTVRKNTIITFPRSEESPLIFKAQAVYADSASVKKDGSIRFPQELKETEENFGSFYVRPKTSNAAMKRLPVAKMITLPGCPLMEWNNPRYRPKVNTFDEWFSQYGRGEMTKETGKYIGDRIIHRDTSAGRFIGRSSCSVRPPNLQIFPHVGNDTKSNRYACRWCMRACTRFNACIAMLCAVSA